MEQQEQEVERGGRPVKLEGIWAVAMGGLLFQICREIDDHNSIEGAFLQYKTFITFPDYTDWSRAALLGLPR